MTELAISFCHYFLSLKDRDLVPNPVVLHFLFRHFIHLPSSHPERMERRMRLLWQQRAHREAKYK